MNELNNKHLDLDIYDDTQLSYIGYEEYSCNDIYTEYDETYCVVVDNKVVYYRLDDNNGIVYTDKLGNEIEVSIDNMKLINKKGYTMTTDYNKTMATYGLDEGTIDMFRARGCAYKEHSIVDGKLYVGSYLMLDNNNEPFTVLETTYKGQLTKSYDVNPRTIGFYNLGELENIANINKVGEFEVSVKNEVNSSDVDSLFEANTMPSKHTIEVYRVQIGKSIDVVIYYNTVTRQNTGSKLWKVYNAEQTLRHKPKNLDDIFDSRIEAENKAQSLNQDDKHINE
jgi:hypothetical protein